MAQSTAGTSLAGHINLPRRSTCSRPSPKRGRIESGSPGRNVVNAMCWTRLRIWRTLCSCSVINATSTLRDTGQMPLPVRLLDPLPFTVTGVQHGSAFMLRLTLLTLLSLGRSTYLHRLMRYMVRVRLKYSLWSSKAGGLGCADQAAGPRKLIRGPIALS